MTANIQAGIPQLLDLLEEHGIADNFRRLSGRRQVERRGFAASLDQPRGRLYRRLGTEPVLERTEAELTATPYYA